MARRKSVDTIRNQANRLRTQADYQYGDSDRGRQIRQRVTNASNRYISNIAASIGGDRNGGTFDSAFGNKSYQTVPRSVYMGLSNG